MVYAGIIIYIMMFLFAECLMRFWSIAINSDNLNQRYITLNHDPVSEFYFTNVK